MALLLTKRSISLPVFVIGASLVLSCVGFDCQPPKIVLDCRRKQLTTFPTRQCGLNKTNVHCLILSNNRIKNVTASMFSSLKNLQTLDLSKNKIKQLTTSMFSGLTNLKELNLAKNRITQVRASTFSGLVNLQKLVLSDNGLLYVQPGALDGLVSLTDLNLEKNKLHEVPHFNVSSKVTTLRLAYNPITSLQLSTMRKYPQLLYLFLTETRITRLTDRIFSYNRKLRLLNLVNTPLEHVDEDAFDGVQLHNLNLEETRITKLPGKGMESLNYLNIQNVKSLWELPFKSFNNLWKAKVEYHFHCCLFKTYYDNAEASKPNLKNYSTARICPTTVPSTTTNQKTKTDETSSSDDIFGKHKGSYEKKNYTVTFPPTLCINIGDSNVHSTKEKKKLICEPLPDAFNPCEDLLGSMELRICTWFVLILALLGNGLQLMVLLTSKRNTTMYRVLMCNLSLANLFMGIYLLVLAVIDAQTYSEYQNHAKAWQFGPGCNIAGFISILSTELAMYTLTVITVERYFTIVHPLKLDMHLSTRQIVILMVFGWVFALTMSLLPIFNVSSYQRVAICLPFDVETLVSKLYVTVLLTTNGVAFFSVLFCYTKMYFSLGGASCSSASSATRVESRVAKKMALLVFSNFACWFPIALFGLIAVYGSPLIDVPTSKFLLVFVYPINAFTNPYLYALGTKHFQLDLLDLVKQFGICPKGSEKIRNRLLDQITSLPNTSKAYMGSRSSINSYRLSTRDRSPKILAARSGPNSSASAFSCRFLPIPKINFSSWGDPTDSTDRSRASSESTSDYSNSQIQPLVKEHKNGSNAGRDVSHLEACRLSAREVIVGGHIVGRNKCECNPTNHSPHDCHKPLDLEEGCKDENVEQYYEGSLKQLPVLMVTSC